MNARKVLEMGGGTYLVSIPKAWAKKNGITKGATVSVEELSGRKLLLRPIEDVQEKPKEVVIEYPGEDLAQVRNDLTGAYLLGYDVIRIQGRNVISREDRAGIKATMGRLVGLEIMDEDSKRMTVQFLLESSAIVPERIVRRMSGLLEGMLRDTLEGLAKGDRKLLAIVGERDDEVDRLYFLLVRATRDAIIRPGVAESYGLTPVDVLDYRVVASFLESVGDAVTELSKRLNASPTSKQASRAYGSCVSRLIEMNELATKAFISRRAGRLGSPNLKVQSLAGEVNALIAEASSRQGGEGSGVAEILGSLDRVSKLLVDVSDLAVITHATAQ
ncbi:MAG: phosphate uptake regulator PhoU [archaeon]|nr:MAG: phosphate uptake regulator PhoU [archaeon]